MFVARVAVMSGLLTALKFALSFIPNVEIVTLLILVYASAFGSRYTIPATLVFCAVEVAIYGVGSWALLYFVFWPLLALSACLLLKSKKTIVAVSLAFVSSVVFGVLSACCDTLFNIGFVPAGRLGVYWVAYYLRGVVFDIVHTVSNTIVVALLYRPMLIVVQRTSNQL